MTYKCMPRAAMRCWQFSESDETVPRWALPFIVTEGVSLLFQNENDTPLAIDHRDWLVEMCEGTVLLWTDTEFRKHFDLME